MVKFTSAFRWGPEQLALEFLQERRRGHKNVFGPSGLKNLTICFPCCFPDVYSQFMFYIKTG